MKESELLATAYKTVATFSSILDTRISLVNHEESFSADYVVAAPFNDPHFYSRVEYGLARIAFGSNAQARDAFVYNYTEAISEKLRRFGREFNERGFRNGVGYLLGLLEEERVLSLWGQLYAGSEMFIREYRRAETDHLVEGCEYNILHYATVITTFAPPEGLIESELSWFEPVFRRALGRIRFGTFQTTLLVTKQLVLEIIDLLIELARHEGGSCSDKPADFEERLAALNQLSSGIASPPESQRSVTEGFRAPSNIEEGSGAKAQRQAMTAINACGNSVDARIEEERSVMANWLDRVKSRASVATQHAKGTDVGANKARVSIAEVTRSDVDSEGYILSAQDRSDVHQMRAMFYRVMGRRNQVLEEYGTELDTLAVIQRKSSCRHTPIYRAETPGRGFRALLLTDRSGSMEGPKTFQCDRARKLIQAALDFPFVTVNTWGFCGIASGSALITKFENNVPSLEVRGHLSPIAGSTPLHIALRVARTEMAKGSEKKHVFLITDGAPMFWNWDGSPIRAAALRKQVRQEINEARKSGIGVTTLVIKSQWGLPEGLTRSRLEKMLGPSYTWRVLSDSGRFGKELSDTVVESFSRYLQHG
jgi:hypothetical protein